MNCRTIMLAAITALILTACPNMLQQISQDETPEELPSNLHLRWKALKHVLPIKNYTCTGPNPQTRHGTTLICDTGLQAKRTKR